MIKLYKTLSGLYGVLEDDKIVEVIPEYQESLLDLAQANAVYPSVFSAALSNLEEWNRRRDEKWRKANPNPEPCMHAPSLMSFSLPHTRPCIVVQIGNQLFYFDEESDVVFDLVVKEKSQ